MADPIEDAWRWLETTLKGRPLPGLVVAIGLPDESLLAALEQRAPETRVLALEPDAVRARRFLYQPAARRWRTSGRLTYLAGPAYDGADEAWRAFPGDPEDHVILVAPAVAEQGGAPAVDAARTLKRIVFGARANAEARRQFAPRYLANVLRNAPAIAAGRDVRALTDAYRRQAAIIVAAGPSLDQAIEALRQIGDRALIIAADTTLRPLLAADVAPHLVVGVDPSELNARHFHGLPPCPKTWLVSEGALAPEAQQHFGDRTFWFKVGDHEPWPWLRELGVDVGLLEVWGSVVTAAFQVARLAGCDPIAFVGADLSYTEGRPYCRGTTYEFEWAASTAAGVGLEALWQATLDRVEGVTAPDMHGRPARTTPALLAFRDWLVTHATRSGRRIVNASDAGLLFAPGIEQRPLAQVIPSDMRIAPPDRAAAASSAPRPALSAPLERMRDTLVAGATDRTIERWAATLGSAWNARDVAAAVEAAAQSVRGGGQDRDAHQSMVPGHLLPRLPEALGRWRAALSGAPTPPLHGPRTNASAALVQALALSVRIARRLLAGRVAVQPRAGMQGIDAVPLSAAYDWPGTMAWDVRAVDGLLGVAVQGPLGQPPPSFFTAPVTPRAPLGNGDPMSQTGDRDRAVACGRLAMDWAACASGGTVPPAPEDVPDLAGMALPRLVSLLAPPDDTACEPVAATLTLTAMNDGVSDRVDVPLTLDARSLARLETGAWLDDRAEDARRPAAAAPPIQREVRDASAVAAASLRLARPDQPRRSLRRPGYHGCDGRLVPRVLTDAGVPRANVAYATSGAVVCVAHHRNQSFKILPDGTTSPAHEWPRSIILELPFGTGGLVAWSNGAADWERPTGGYVMYRHGPASPVAIEELPFRPGWGAWWGERLHWSCFRSGLGSWAPGAPPVLALETVALLTVDALDEGVSLVPAARDDRGVLQRRRSPHALVLGFDGAPARTVACGPWGPRTAHAIGSHGWRAEAFAESDVVRLASPDGGAVTLACYYPMKLAWLGPSLLVSTLEGELLLFEDVVSRLQATEGLA